MRIVGNLTPRKPRLVGACSAGGAQAPARDRHGDDHGDRDNARTFT